MSYFTMGKYKNKEYLYKDKASYLESVIKAIVDVHELDGSVWEDEDTGLWCSEPSVGGLLFVWGEL